MSLHRRLEQLEEQAKSGEGPGGGMSSREWTLYFHAQENARRELRGLEALPDLEYTKEDRENDIGALKNVIPVYRASAGWQSEEGQTKLDAWEEQLKQRIEGTR